MGAEDAVMDQRPRARASFAAQAGALARKQLAFQRRRWGANACLLAAPFAVCCLLYALQEVVNAQLDAPAFRCGCRCLACCDWVPAPAGAGAAPGAAESTPPEAAAPTTYEFQCYNATEERPCSPAAACSARDASACGYLYSTADQAAFCGVASPPVWPALLAVPRAARRGPKYAALEPGGVRPAAAELPPAGAPGGEGGPAGAPPAPLLYTGADRGAAGALMAALWGRDAGVAEAALAAFTRAQAAGEVAAGATPADLAGAPAGPPPATEAEFVAATAALARGLREFGLVMGTSAPTALTLLMEPAFVAAGNGSAGAAGRAPLYFASPDCGALPPQDAATLARIGEAVTNLTGVPVECASLAPAWAPSAADLQSQLYCGWRGAGCAYRAGAAPAGRRFLGRAELLEAGAAAAAGGAAAAGWRDTQEWASAALDWRDTRRGARLALTVYANNTNVARPPGPQDVQRWNQPVNLAANAFLRDAAPAAGYGARLAGVQDMPRAASRLTLDFSSLLGPLFMMWFMQLLLPVNVYALVAEKERSLRVMMRMQGLRDGVYAAVSYAFMLALYAAFMAVFVAFGSAIGLRIFAANAASVQAVFYGLWGLVLASTSLAASAFQREARPAVLLAVVYVIVSGFAANMVLAQYVERGPAWLAHALQWVPSFGLYRGLYELAQYAFLAGRTGGSGLTWAKLADPGCGMLRVWGVFAAEAAALPALAAYVEAVNGSGAGARRHWLFFLGGRWGAGPAAPRGPARPPPAARRGARRPWWRWARRAAGGAGGKAGAGAVELDAWPAGGAAEPPAGSGSSSPARGGGGGGGGGVPRKSTMDAYGGGGAAAAGTAAGGAMSALQQQRRAAEAAAAAKGARRASAGRLLAPAAGGAAAGEEEEQEGPDVAAERARVDALLAGWRADCARAELGQLRGGAPPRRGRGPFGLFPSPSSSGAAAAAQPGPHAARRPPAPAAILLSRLRKVYPSASGGGADTVAVAGLSLAVRRSECFGLLGPNGAGKTTAMRVVEGFLAASGGEALVEGLPVGGRDQGEIYSLMGACPQHDLLWPELTGAEHLAFYARLKGLAGAGAAAAARDALRAVGLSAAADEAVSAYSGGMRRRLSVGVALVGDPAVVFLDEPSTGLDPASRRLLWAAVRAARRRAAVVLTTHSMEEAEALCDRLGIFVGGRLACVGAPRELVARFGGCLLLSLTTPPGDGGAEAAARALARGLAPGARAVYALGGTQRFELPAAEVGVDAVFRAVEAARAGPGGAAAGGGGGDEASGGEASGDEIAAAGGGAAGGSGGGAAGGSGGGAAGGSGGGAAAAAAAPLRLLDWGVSHATLEEVFIKVTRGAGVRLSAFT